MVKLKMEDKEKIQIQELLINLREQEFYELNLFFEKMIKLKENK